MILVKITNITIEMSTAVITVTTKLKLTIIILRGIRVKGALMEILPMTLIIFNVILIVLIIILQMNTLSDCTFTQP